MVRDRLFALIFRTTAFLVGISGLILGSGHNTGAVRFLYYTAQSNILFLLLLLFLIIKTAADLIKHGRRGCACYCPRAEMAVMLTISFTFIIFWSGFWTFDGIGNLLSFGNIVMHAVMPLAAVCDYFLFCEAGHLKRRDILLAALIPAAYLIQIGILSACRVVFYVLDGTPYYAPYLFMDYRTVGLFAPLAVFFVASIFIACAALLYRLDNRRKNACLHGHFCDNLKRFKPRPSGRNGIFKIINFENPGAGVALRFDNFYSKRKNPRIRRHKKSLNP